MAPEQWLNKTIDGRTDIYAIGCIMFEMNKGYPLFSASSVKELYHKHLEERFPINKIDNKELEIIIRKCVEKKPARRFQAIEALQEDLISLYKDCYNQTPILHAGKNKSSVIDLK